MWFSRNPKVNEQTPLLFDQNATLPGFSPFADSNVSHDIIRLIAAKLDNKSIAAFAQTNKKIHAAVQQAPTYIDFTETDANQNTVTYRLQASYAVIRDNLNQRYQAEKRIAAIEPGKFAKYLHSDAGKSQHICAVISAAAVTLFGGISLAAISTSWIYRAVGITVALGVTPATFLAGAYQFTLFNRSVAEKEGHARSLREELNKSHRNFSMV